MAERTNIATQTQVSDKSHPRTADAIRQDIAATRESISGTVDRLGERIHENLDWRSYVTQYPIVAVGFAAGTGFVMSAIFKRRPTPRERMLEAVADSVEEITDRFRNNIGDIIQKKNSGMGDTFKKLIAGAITAGLSSVVKKKANQLVTAPALTQTPKQPDASRIEIVESEYSKAGYVGS